MNDQELKGMKLQVLKSMDEEERKEVYAKIAKRGKMLDEELLKMKANQQRPTISYIRNVLGYNISPKAIHIRLHKLWGDDLGDATLHAPRKSKILVQSGGKIDIEKTVEKVQARRNLEESPSLKDIKRIKKMGNAAAIKWLTKVATGSLSSDLVTSEQAQTILDQEEQA